MSSSAGSDEGEIVESETEKATTSLPSVHGNPVDRPSRSPVPAQRRADDHGPQPPRRRRSPYDDHTARGEKRPRDDEPDSERYSSDPRRFRVHYEGHREEPMRSRLPYDDLDRGNGGRSSLHHDDTEYTDRHRKRPRTRSRSPDRYASRGGVGRASRGSQAYHREDTYGRGRQSGVNQAHGRNSFNRQSVSKGAEVSRPDDRSRHKTEQQRKDPNLDPNRSATSAADDRSRGNLAALSEASTSLAESEPVDEAALIEERRKRREAIKAKYKGQSTPLLVQALHLGSDTTASNTPAASGSDEPERSLLSKASPEGSPALTPNEGSRELSPAVLDISNHDDVTNGTTGAQADGDLDEPSAADYDPTLDMREDRMRDEQRHQGEDVSSAAYDETKTVAQDILLPPSKASEGQQPDRAKDELDMFADDDDDMFAEVPTEPRIRTDKEDTARAVAVPQGKQLDMSMLDDWDDHEGYYRVILGELLDGRYHVQANLGKGMFSGVVRAMDAKTKKLVAIKLIRSNETMKKAGLKEIEILQKLNQADAEDKKHMIRLERYFEHKGHLCMVFENLSINLREVLKKFGRDVGINIRAVRTYAHQMFMGLSLLRKCNILHADVKPDNVLVNESRSMLKICDLGSASDASENEITPYLVSRFYRAPEIILGLPYDFALDTWSVGCTLYELYTGKILFTGRTNNQMLRSIMECRGKFSHKMLRKAQFAPMHFDDLLNFRSVEVDKMSGKDVIRTLTFAKPTRDLKTRLLSTTKGMNEAEVKDLHLFVDLLDRCLNLNPEKRCTPSEALRHGFFMRGKV